MITNIEDCLEYLAGLRHSSVKFEVDKSDATIIYSIARQVFRGTPLTDRQLALMQLKLQVYREQFTNLDWDFDFAVENLRQPLRHIDRTKYIKIVDNNLEIRFPFRKTEIMLVQEAAFNAEGYHHEKGSHKHTFALNETNILKLVSKFINKDFEIDKEILDLYNEIKEIHDNPKDYLSGISNMKLVNVDSKLETIIKEELGNLNNQNFVKFIDRKFRYGFAHIEDIKETTLTEKIAARKTKTYHSQPSKELSDAVLSSLWELDRFPMLVILDSNNAENQLYEMANYYRDILDPTEQSVLFRLEDKDAGFNQLVKDRKLNNWVDKNTKIVYINSNKLPKIIVNNEWKPITTFTYASRYDRMIESYVSFNCDLVVYREEQISPLRKYSRYYG
jgi:hypothetical protein